MTSEPDSTPRRRPPTIDLTATEIEPEKPAEATAPASKADDDAAGRADGNFSRGLRHHVQGALAGMIVVAAVFAALWFSGALPSRQPAGPAVPQASNVNGTDEISARLDKIQGALQSQQGAAELGSRVTAAEAATKALGNSLADLTRRVDEVTTTAQGALAQVKSVSTAVGQAAATAQDAIAQAKSASSAAAQATNDAKTNLQRSDIDVLAGRVAAIESRVTSISGNMANQHPSADDRAARLTITTAALRNEVERGAPYQAELTAVKAFGVGPDATAPLEQFASSGVPTAAALGQELAALTPKLARASGKAPSEGSYLDRLETSAQRLVRVTPVDAPVGDQPSAVIARIKADAERADIAGVRAEIPRLPESAKILAAPWTQKAAARDAAIAASRRIAADALGAIVKPNAQ